MKLSEFIDKIENSGWDWVNRTYHVEFQYRQHIYRWRDDNKKNLSTSWQLWHYPESVIHGEHIEANTLEALWQVLYAQQEQAEPLNKIDETLEDFVTTS